MAEHIEPQEVDLERLDYSMAVMGHTFLYPHLGAGNEGSPVVSFGFEVCGLRLTDRDESDQGRHDAQHLAAEMTRINPEVGDLFIIGEGSSELGPITDPDSIEPLSGEFSKTEVSVEGIYRGVQVAMVRVGRDNEGQAILEPRFVHVVGMIETSDTLNKEGLYGEREVPYYFEHGETYFELSDTEDSFEDLEDDDIADVIDILSEEKPDPAELLRRLEVLFDVSPDCTPIEAALWFRRLDYLNSRITLNDRDVIKTPFMYVMTSENSAAVCDDGSYFVRPGNGFSLRKSIGLGKGSATAELEKPTLYLNGIYEDREAIIPCGVEIEIVKGFRQ
jgi:hypothetical protein